jgi:DEAD/DEAH box helicase domain-containing protein
MTSADEPLPGSAERRRFLLLYDTVPGGTGYLQDLSSSAGAFLEVLRLARDVMTRCACNADPAKDGCYACLYAYRNSNGMESTSRDTAVRLLSNILEREGELETVRTVSDINANPVLESELEARFVEALQRLSLEGVDVQVQQQVVNGKPGYLLRAGTNLYTVEPQVPLGPAAGVQLASCPDFLIRSARSADPFQPIAVFLDGFQYHKDKVTDDTLKRLAIVQSGKFREWSLTWWDVNPQFAASDARNPFVEGLQATMQPVQQAIAAKLGVGAMTDVAVRPPLEQLVRFLADPAEARWTALAMVRALGWFEQASMRDPTTAQRFQEHLAACGATGFQHLVQNSPGELAYGGLTPEPAKDPLSIWCYLPLAAISAAEPQRLCASILLDTGGAEPEVFKAAWIGFLRLYNLLQFLPAVQFATVQGTASAAYEVIQWKRAQTALGMPGHEAPPAEDPKFAELLAVVDGWLAPHLRSLGAQGCPLPEAGYELEGPGGEVVAEAELAWPDERIAVLREDQADMSAIWADAGWCAMPLGGVETWTAAVTARCGALGGS